MGDLSKNFSRFEFACRCGCGFDDVDAKLVEALQKLRDFLGRPLHINSGCRCKAHNKACGGVPDSQHLKGRAADVTTKMLTPRELANIVEDNILEFANGGIGVYPGFVHLDVGPKRRW